MSTEEATQPDAGPGKADGGVRLVYAVMTTAYRGEEVSATLSLRPALSRDDARGWGLRDVEARKPRPDGWAGHQVTVSTAICRPEHYIGEDASS